MLPQLVLQCSGGDCCRDRRVLLYLCPVAQIEREHIKGVGTCAGLCKIVLLSPDSSKKKIIFKTLIYHLTAR